MVLVLLHYLITLAFGVCEIGHYKTNIYLIMTSLFLPGSVHSDVCTYVFYVYT